MSNKTFMKTPKFLPLKGTKVLFTNKQTDKPTNHWYAIIYMGYQLYKEKPLYPTFKGAGYSNYSCQSMEKLSANNTSSKARKLKISTEVKYY